MTKKSESKTSSDCKSKSSKTTSISDDTECCPLTSEEIFTKFGSAVVQVNSEFWCFKPVEDPPGTTLLNNVLPPCGTDGTEVDSMYTIIGTNGSGFFINNNYIVCPASLVLAPPSISSIVAVYPGQKGSSATGSNPCDMGKFGCEGTIKNNYIRATNISVTVSNVNGKQYSFRYRAKLVGVDGAGDIAVLLIDSNDVCNKNNPCIDKCHPFFKFGSSKNSKPGSKVYLIGDANASNPNSPLKSYETSFVEGTLNNNRYTDPKGWVLAECVSVTASVFGYSTGLPIIDKCGKVIGMQTLAINPTLLSIEVNPSPDCSPASCTSMGDNCIPLFDNVVVDMGRVIGPSEFMMRKVVKELVEGSFNKKHRNKRIKKIGCGINSFLVYQKSYLGIAYSKFTAFNYDKKVKICDSETVCCKNEFNSTLYQPNCCGTNCNTCTSCLGCPGQPTNCNTTCYQVAGIVVDGLAGRNPDGCISLDNSSEKFAYYVPGKPVSDCFTTDQLSSIVNPCSEFLLNYDVSLIQCLKVGDVITHIDSIPICNNQNIISPSLITWRDIKPDQSDSDSDNDDQDCVSLTFRPVECCYEGLCTTNAKIMTMAPGIDYPWYALKQFPNIRYIICNDGTFDTSTICDESIPYPPCQNIMDLYPNVSPSCMGCLFKPSI